MLTQFWFLIIITTLFPPSAPCRATQSPVNEAQVRAAITGSLRASGYEVTLRRSGADSEVIDLEQRDSEGYNPSSMMMFRLRSLQPWENQGATYFRYWLLRETYASQELAEKRGKEYLAGYTERLETARMSRHMISKTILRVEAKRRGTTVYLLVTDGSYTVHYDKQRARMLDRLVTADNT